MTSHCKGLVVLWLSLLNDSSPIIRIPPEILRTYVFKIHITDPSVWSYHYFESLFLHKELKKTSYQNWFEPVSSSLAAHASTFYEQYTLFKIAYVSPYIFPISMIFWHVFPTGKKGGYTPLSFLSPYKGPSCWKLDSFSPFLFRISCSFSGKHMSSWWFSCTFRIKFITDLHVLQSHWAALTIPCIPQCQGHPTADRDEWERRNRHIPEGSGLWKASNLGYVLYYKPGYSRSSFFFFCMPLSIL